jgi:hypothetical protein
MLVLIIIIIIIIIVVVVIIVALVVDVVIVNIALSHHDSIFESFSSSLLSIRIAFISSSPLH